MDNVRSLPGGKLEYAVLAALWESGVATARDVHERVGVPLGLVQTTTARVLDRLALAARGAPAHCGLNARASTGARPSVFTTSRVRHPSYDTRRIVRWTSFMP